MKKIILIILLYLIYLSTPAQNTLGLLVNEENSYNGISALTLNWTDIVLVNNCGEVVHFWDNPLPLKSCYILENGTLLKQSNPMINVGLTSSAGTGAFEIVDWDNNILWSYTYAEYLDYIAHHDIEPLSNGNFLVIAWEYHSDIEAIAEGRDENSILFNSLWPDKIVEMQPIGSNSVHIPWEWTTWDHMVQDRDPAKPNYVEDIADAPHRLDINFFDINPSDDWMHVNSLSYNEELDIIVFSSRHLKELIIIDHSTTAIEVKGSEGGNFQKGGDFLWRWGNPKSHGKGDESDKKLFSQHGARFISSGKKDEGKILVFNNGVQRPEGNYSTIEMINPTMNEYRTEFIFDPVTGFGPDSAYRTYTPSPDTLENFYSPIGSSAMQLPNDNIYVAHNMEGYVFEIDSNNNVLWKYQKPVADINIDTFPQGTPVDLNLGIRQFKSIKYDFHYPGLDGKDLSPKGFISHPDDPEPDSCTVIIPDPISTIESFQSLVNVFPNPTSDYVTLSGENLVMNEILLFDALANSVYVNSRQISSSRILFDVSQLRAGIYFISIQSKDGNSLTRRIVKI